MDEMGIVKRVTVIAGRWIDQKWTSLKFKFTVLQFNIVKMNVKGQTWKIDCTGYVLEDGTGMYWLCSCDVHSLNAGSH